MTQLTAVAPRRYPLKTAANPAFTPDQVAQAFINEGNRRNIAAVGIQEAICCGLDESGLRVLANPNDPASESLPNDGDGYDHASDGPLQQQPPWWGTVECRMDPTCSVGMFYDHLVQLDYTNLAAHTAGWWIQQVQNSFDPTGSNYDAQWPTAVAIYNRLAVGAPGIPQSNVDLAISIFVARINDPYVFGGAFSPTDPGVGTDCSGMCDTILQALTHGQAMQWGRHVSTESWPYDYANDLAAPVGTVGPYGTICAGDAQPGPAPTHYPPQIPSDAAAIIYLMHGGGGENSHMMIAVNDGTGNYIVMETGGAHNDTGGNGQYASRNGEATPTNDPEWTDIWYLPGPVTSASGGDEFMSALSDQQQVEMYNALCQPQESQSPFRDLGETTKWSSGDLIHNGDGFSHPQFVEWAAERGDSRELQRLQTLANADPRQLYNGEDRSEDIALAAATLTRVEAVLSGQTPPNVVTPNVVPMPTPLPGPVGPIVVPPTPAPSAVNTPITLAQIVSWGKDAVTIIGTIGTWATAIHGLLGQFLPGTSGVIVPTLLAGATTVSAGHTVHRQRMTEKANRMLLKSRTR